MERLMTDDRRRLPIRDDLADANLRAKAPGRRYVAGREARVATPVLDVRRDPGPDAPLDTQALFGETVTVFDVAAGWAWVQLARDAYVGYVRADGLAGRLPPPATHRIVARSALVYRQPSAVSPPLRMLPLNALVSAIAGEIDAFVEIEGGGFIGRRHLARVDAAFAADFVTVAEGYHGVPYLFGGCTAIDGIDCSGLVQMALAAAGIRAPRDSDMQEAEIGDAIDIGENLAGLRRGDLVFWPGHVGIMTSPARVVHANATNMSVTHEPIDAVAARSRKGGPVIASVRRLA